MGVRNYCAIRVACENKLAVYNDQRLTSIREPSLLGHELSVSLTDFLQSYIMRNALLKILYSFLTLKRSVAKVTDSIGL
jgi:hypothetical protein